MIALSLLVLLLKETLLANTLGSEKKSGRESSVDKYHEKHQVMRLEESTPGQILKINGREIKVLEIDITPLIENTYSKRGVYESADNPKLKMIREQEGFDKMLAGVQNEFDQQVLILDWSQRRLPKFGSPTIKANAPLDILKAADEGHTFYCNHYARIFVGAAASIGWVCRTLALHVGNNPSIKGAPEHSACEVWSDVYRKWIYFDPLFGMYIERDGIPLTAWEARQEWFYGDRDKLNFVLGKDRKIYKHTDMPVPLSVHPGFGTLSLGPIDKLALMGYVPGNNVIDNGGLNYEEMFICTDTLSSRIKWHIRIRPDNPAVEPYFPMNQADLQFIPVRKGFEVRIRTNTPNFAHYRYRINKGEWVNGEPGIWEMRRGINILEVRPVNTFGVEGVVSRVVLDVDPDRKNVS